MSKQRALTPPKRAASPLAMGRGGEEPGEGGHQCSSSGLSTVAASPLPVPLEESWQRRAVRRNLEADGAAAPWVLQELDGEHREEQEGA